MKTKIKFQCSLCVGGEIFYFYKNESNRTVRCDYEICPDCFPGADATVRTYPGEVEINEALFNELDANGWGPADI